MVVDREESGPGASVSREEVVKFSHKFLIMPESFSLLVGRDILKKVQASVFTNMEPILFN